MKLEYVICPDTSSITQRDYLYYKKFEGKNYEWRSLSSEIFAFEYLKIKDVIIREEDLINMYANRSIKIPECIAVDPNDSSKIISVEVKRICGNNLPKDYEGQKRRIKRGRRNKIVWPWEKTIVEGMTKAHPTLINDMQITAHHSVFVIPSSLNKKELRKVCSHIVNTALDKQDHLHCHTTVHVIQGNEFMFDRLI